mmetsp:Transcript_59840/g.137257  ORF Transcript_59840/g.137257 Transcript_59840/m.137257 type:complete len:149 (-) Transcript_59840:66-512(-)
MLGRDGPLIDGNLAHLSNQSLADFAVYVIVDKLLGQPSEAASAEPHRVGLTELYASISGIEQYEFELSSTASKADSTRRVLQFRCDTWRSLHAWVNGLTLLTAHVRSNALQQRPSQERAAGMMSMPMSVWARDQAAVRRAAAERRSAD